MSNRIKEIFLKYWLLIFLAFIGLYMAIFKVSVRDFWKGLRSLTLWQLAVLLAIYFVLSGLNILLRKYLLISLGENASLKNLSIIHFTSMAAHYSTPAKLGFPVTVALLNQLESIAPSIGAAVIIIELAVSTAVCGFIGAIGTLFYFSESRLILIFFTVATVALIIVSILRRASANTHLGFLEKLSSRLTSGLRLLTPRAAVCYTAMRTIIQLTAGINLFLLCRFLSADISYPQAVVTGSSAFFIGALSMVPMGLGVREGSSLLYLTKFGVMANQGISIVTIQRLISTGLSFALGILFSAVLGIGQVLRYDSQENSE